MTKAQTAISFLVWYRKMAKESDIIEMKTPTEAYELYYKERQARLAKSRETPDQSAAEDHLDYLESKW